MFKTTIKSKIKSTGIYLPKKVLTNRDLEKTLDTDDKWIFDRTGIRARHISSTEGGEFPTDMGQYAAQDALKEMGLEANDIHAIIFATVTPDVKIASSACILQKKLGITNKCMAFDISAACSGFVYAMALADSFIKLGTADNILIVGSEMISSEIDWRDRNTAILFGDGCGVCVMGKNDDNTDSEILSTHLGADGSGADFFVQPVGGSASPITKEHLERPNTSVVMDGKKMFKIATRTLAENAHMVVKQAGLTLEDVSWLVPHQANARIIETAGKLAGIPQEKVIVNIEKYANTSSATVPIAFHEAVQDGRIQRGDIVLLNAFGAGLTNGAILLRY